MIFTVKVRNSAQDLAVRFFHHGFRERSVVMFVVDLYLTLSYFVGFVHDYCSAPLVRFFKVDVCVLLKFC